MDEWIEYILLEKIQNISANTLFFHEKRTMLVTLLSKLLEGSWMLRLLQITQCKV